ncbi:MAG: ClbS/DfsB family four-helix bundle protein [Chloroflexi bacterium]|nr:ClbS/DfsB family four-helix bundle protein [Chloroflexota bacterium]
MTVKDKQYLLDLLTETHSALSLTVAEIDPETQVYTENDTDWRVRDILGHVATWDRQVAMSLRAYRTGTEYLIPDLDEDDFNQQAVLKQRELTTQQLFAEWENAREEFKEAVRDIPDDQFPGDLLYPWGDERGAIATLVEYMANHSIEHRDEIVQAVEETGKTLLG